MSDPRGSVISASVHSTARLLVGLALVLACTVPPAFPQSDGDGVPDSWKNTGSVQITLPTGKTQKLDLNQDGPVSRGHRDIFVWIAWMEDSTHTHKPDSQAVQTVKNAFANAPIQNLDGTSGIRLHIYFSSLPLTEIPTFGSGDIDHYDWSSFDAAKKRFLPNELRNVFHFCIFVHDIDKEHYSGLSREFGGYDFIVSLGAFGVNGKVAGPTAQAGTFMHELGHNLGLRHGGGDDVNYKSNYVSVMNYFFQLSGVPVDLAVGNFDYSRFAADVDENKLDKKLGLNVSATLARYGTRHFCKPNKNKSESDDSIVGPIDWNCSGSLSGKVSQDINDDSKVDVLAGFDDWRHIRLVYQTPNAGLTATANISPKDELSLRKANEIPLPPVAHVQVRPAGEGVVVSWKKIPLDRVVAYRVIRKSASGEEKELGLTADAGFVDTNPPYGSSSYYVSGIYALYGNPTLEDLGIDFEAGTFAKFITSQHEIMAVRDGGAGTVQNSQSAGLKYGISEAVNEQLHLLVETPLSKPGVIAIE